MTAERNTLVSLKRITAGYGTQIALRDVDLDIADQDFIGVIGPNGGGKTTLVKVILGLLKPFQGEVRYHFDPAEQSMGYLPQVSNLDKRFPITVLDIVLSGLLNRSMLFRKFTREEKEKAENLLNNIGIAHLRRKTIGELSGGQMQRVFLCRAIISSPCLLILDEPNSYVDNNFEGELYEILRKLNEEMAIVMVTHDMGIVSTHVKTIACVNMELNYHPSNLITEEQLASYNCPVKLITHGDVPHTVLHKHHH